MHGIAVATLLLSLSTASTGQAPAAPAAPGPLVQAEALLQRGRDEGVRLATAGDKEAGAAARKDFHEAERIVKSELKRNAGCQRCVELQAGILLLRSVFKFDDAYDDCVEIATAGLERFPQSAELAYVKGYAHYNRAQAHEAAGSLTRFLALAPEDARAGEVRQMLKAAQDQFLGAWYNQANFYQSNESRISSFNAQTLRNDVVFQFTPSYELELGQKGYDALSQSAPVANDPEAVAFIQQLVGRLIEKTPGPGFSYQVKVLDSPEVNAVTPPGYIVVFAGLLRAVDTEAQLAGVLAHEIAHNYGHHSARRLIKEYHSQQIVAGIAKAVNPQSVVAQAVTQLSASLGLNLFLKAYSRFEEKEADLYGSHLMFNAGYNPTALPSLFLKLYEANPRQPPKLLSTHPPQPDRINYLSDYLQGFPLDRDLVVDSSEAFKKLKERYPSASTTTNAAPRIAIPGLPGAPAPSPSTPAPNEPAPAPTPAPVQPSSAPAPATPAPAAPPPPTAPAPPTTPVAGAPPADLPPMPGGAPGLVPSGGRAPARVLPPPTSPSAAPPVTPAPPPASAPSSSGAARPPIVPPAPAPANRETATMADCEAARATLPRLNDEQSRVRSRITETAGRLLAAIDEERKSGNADATKRRELIAQELALLKAQDAQIAVEQNRARDVLLAAVCR